MLRKGGPLPLMAGQQAMGDTLLLLSGPHNPPGAPGKCPNRSPWLPQRLHLAPYFHHRHLWKLWFHYRKHVRPTPHWAGLWAEPALMAPAAPAHPLAPADPGTAPGDYSSYSGLNSSAPNTGHGGRNVTTAHAPQARRAGLPGQQLWRRPGERRHRTCGLGTITWPWLFPSVWNGKTNTARLPSTVPLRKWLQLPSHTCCGLTRMKTDLIPAHASRHWERHDRQL